VEQEGIKFYLSVRGTIEGEVITKLSGPLQELIDEGRIFLETFPFE